MNLDWLIDSEHKTQAARYVFKIFFCYKSNFTLWIWLNIKFSNKYVFVRKSENKNFPVTKDPLKYISICIYSPQGPWTGFLKTFLKYHPYHKYSFWTLCLKRENTKQKRTSIKKCKNKYWKIFVFSLFSVTSISTMNYCSS